ncbi:MAG: SpoIIE family protein phosphatase [Anaerolineales bacterium]|nr:SpoIIE family protein phosphatase [Anaerolineales bacterium]
MSAELTPSLTPHLELQVAAAKITKYASLESGDTIEFVERPHGGLSIVVADGQRSGKSAKAISNIVVRKAISLLAEGVRDGAAARATHDYLLTQRNGKVSAELFIISVDLVTQTLVVSRNARCPSLLRCGDAFSWLDAPAEAVGIHRNTKPAITELPLTAHTTVVVVTDGVWGAGAPNTARIDLPEIVRAIDPGDAPVQVVADAILDAALRLDHDRPHDDATVAVVKLMPRNYGTEVRRVVMHFPI